MSYILFTHNKITIFFLACNLNALSSATIFITLCMINDIVLRRCFSDVWRFSRYVQKRFSPKWIRVYSFGVMLCGDPRQIVVKVIYVRRKKRVYEFNPPVQKKKKFRIIVSYNDIFNIFFLRVILNLFIPLNS